MGSKLKLACGRTEQALTITKCVNCDQCGCDSFYAHFIIEKKKKTSKWRRTNILPLASISPHSSSSLLSLIVRMSYWLVF